MDRIKEILDEMQMKYSITDKNIFIEFWTDTAGQDVSIDIDYDGTIENFIDKFTEYANNYDVDEEVGLFAEMRGKRGIPNTIRELLDDCQEVKDTLTELAEKFKSCVDENYEDEDIKELQKEYHKTYSYLYDNTLNEIIHIIEMDYSSIEYDKRAMDAFNKLCKYEQDFLVSDRERAAFVIAYKIIDRRKQLKRLAEKLYK